MQVITPVEESLTELNLKMDKLLLKNQINREILLLKHSIDIKLFQRFFINVTSRPNCLS